MKKISILLITLLLITGCGSKVKKMTCTKEISDDKSNMKYEDVITYEEKVVSTVNNKMELSFNEENIAYLEMFKGYADASNEQYNKVEGVSSKAESTSNSVILTVDYDLKKMTDENITNYNLNKDIDLLKEFYTTNGYTCK